MALGACLTQRDAEGNHQPVGFASRLLVGPEKNYSTTEQECLAVTWAVENFRPYLHGHFFTLYTDHSALQFLMGGGAARSTNRKHHRWLAELQSYDFASEHRPGKENVVPDALSRCFRVSVPTATNPLEPLCGPGLFFTVAPRPATHAGFHLDSTESGIPTASAFTLAACIASMYTTQPAGCWSPAAVLPITQRLSLPVISDLGHSGQVAAALARAVHDPQPVAYLVPDERARADRSAHCEWLQLLPMLRILDSVASGPPGADSWLVVAATAAIPCLKGQGLEIGRAHV